MEIALVGSSGEPIDFARTIRSHGFTSLPPALDGANPRRYRFRLRFGRHARTIQFEPTDGGDRLIVSCDAVLKAPAQRRLSDIVKRMFRLDEDFGPFYRMIAEDAELEWAADGAGRLLASPTVFEDVVKTICTTNCAWSGTIRMVSALVNDLGGGAFPTAQQMAAAPTEFYAGVARAGYRGPYLRSLAGDVTQKKLDLERLRPQHGLNDEEVEERLLAIAGIGPYACAHIMLLLGRYHRLVFDSWTRPAYLEHAGRRKMSDRSIERRFKRYGNFAGLAFWLLLTRDWVGAREV